MKNILRKTIEIYGERSQIIVAVEELAELIKALQKYHRLDIDLGPEQSVPVINNVQEEIADCLIMLTQLKMIFNEDEINNIIDTKIKRLQEKIQAY